MEIIKSDPSKHEQLSELAKASKKFWGYHDEWLQMWADDLTISENYIVENEVYHIENKNDIVGFYSFIKNESTLTLDFLFVKPEYIGKGIGALLMVDFLKRADKSGFKTIILYADPNAESFYEKFGFKTVSYEHTKIAGRTLPVMTKKLD